MRILFLGGTAFVGLHMVEAALARGHQVTLFNRGQTNANLFPQAEKIRGDRDGGLDPLKGCSWDVVVDVNGYVPRLVGDTARLLKDSVGQYVFVSTGSVYDFMQMKPYADESSALQNLDDETTEEWYGPAYGGLKVLCENVVMDLYPENHFILRLGVVAGPYDVTDRVTYWVTRAAKGGEMLVTGAPDRRMQFIDARDLANFTMLGIEKPLKGIYNTIGNSVSWQHFLDACKDAFHIEPAITWVDDLKFLSENIDMGQREFGAIPMAIPAEYNAILTMKSEKALNDGMVFRSTLNTVRDVQDWDVTRPADEKRVAGMTLEQEKELLEKWNVLA
jgi:2'-hydroxyisoflavone reductase